MLGQELGPGMRGGAEPAQRDLKTSVAQSWQSGGFMLPAHGLPVLGQQHSAMPFT